MAMGPHPDRWAAKTQDSLHLTVRGLTVWEPWSRRLNRNSSPVQEEGTPHKEEVHTGLRRARGWEEVSSTPDPQEPTATK